MLSNKMMISASGSQSNKKKAQILLPLAITAAETQQMPPAPGAARFNFSRIVPVSVSKSTTPKAAKPSTTPSGPLAPAVAQFMVVVHPDYRPAPPTPFQQASGNTYAPKDFCKCLFFVGMLLADFTQYPLKPITSLTLSLQSVGLILPTIPDTSSHNLLLNFLSPMGKTCQTEMEISENL
jgi:hypothetical protein